MIFICHACHLHENIEEKHLLDGVPSKILAVYIVTYSFKDFIRGNSMELGT